MTDTEERRDDPVESGALEDEPEGEREEPPEPHEEPVESGSLEEKER